MQEIQGWGCVLNMFVTAEVCWCLHLAAAGSNGTGKGPGLLAVFFPQPKETLLVGGDGGLKKTQPCDFVCGKTQLSKDILPRQK